MKEVTIEEIYIKLESIFENNESGYDRRLLVYKKLNELLPKWEGINEQSELLKDFFIYFRNNGESNLGMTIEQFVDDFLKNYKK